MRVCLCVICMVNICLRFMDSETFYHARNYTKCNTHCVREILSFLSVCHRTKSENLFRLSRNRKAGVSIEEGVTPKINIASINVEVDDRLQLSGTDRLKASGSTNDIEYGARCTRMSSTPYHGGVTSSTEAPSPGPRGPTHARGPGNWSPHVAQTPTA